MERRVTVNDDSDPPWQDSPDSAAPDVLAGPADDPSADPAPETDEPGWSDLPEIYVGDQLAAPASSQAGTPSPDPSHGPCLYLGTTGERCSKPALAGGFCARHHPDKERRWPGRDYRRVLLASIALIAILWPYFQDAVQLVLRFVRELSAN
jgi:hypothetical protein